MRPLEYTGYVDEVGALHIRNRKVFNTQIARFTGKDVEITIARKRKLRSVPLNKYYWAVVVAMVRDRLEDLGHEITGELVHDYLKGRFNCKEFVNENTAEVLSLPQTTTQMTNTEFMVYMDKIKKWAAEALDIVIPEPNEQIRLKLNDTDENK